ncbi:MAG: CPBP family intramembrane metalloprotease [Planctomycetota bacterium]|nr:CPBP family intramembrane metalloprotease [Planctomycetota bacterium]
MQRLRFLLVAAAVVAVDYAVAHLVGDYVVRMLGALAVVGLGSATRFCTGWSLTYGNVRASLALTWRVSWVFCVIVAGLFLLLVVLVRAFGWQWEVELQNVPRLERFWPWFLLACIHAPLFEEIIYRGVLHPPLRQALGRWPAILVNALVFWISHWVVFGYVTLPNHFVAGVVFAWAYDRTRSLLAPTLLHLLGNLFVALCDVSWLLWQEHYERLLGWG